jgi:hypothetical protein
MDEALDRARESLFHVVAGVFSFFAQHPAFEITVRVWDSHARTTHTLQRLADLYPFVEPPVILGDAAIYHDDTNHISTFKELSNKELVAFQQVLQAKPFPKNLPYGSMLTVAALAFAFRCRCSVYASAFVSAGSSSRRDLIAPGQLSETSSTLDSLLYFDVDFSSSESGTSSPIRLYFTSYDHHFRPIVDIDLSDVKRVRAAVWSADGAGDHLVYLKPLRQLTSARYLTPVPMS